MPSNSTGTLMDELDARFPGQLQSLMCVGRWWSSARPYALDNGAFGAWKNGEPWNEAAFFDLCDRAAAHRVPPRWVVCPDVVADWPATLSAWEHWAPRLRATYGWHLALAVQDGATATDVQGHTDADLLFVGGSSRFKWRTLGRWCGVAVRVHVGRVNTVRSAWAAKRAGAESIDGTGWMRTDRQRAGLIRFLQHQADELSRNPELPPDLWEHAE